MGCASSKEDDLPLVSLCRQRRDLIRAASDRRYDLAAAHASYFRALDRVGDALHRFVTEDLTAVQSPPASPVLTLPPSDVKSKSKSDGGSNGSGDGDGNGNRIGDSRHLSSCTSSISLSSSSLESDFSHSHLPEENADSHVHLGSGAGSEPEPGGGFGGQGRFSAYPPQFSSFLNPNFYLDPITGRSGYRHPHLPLQDEAQFSSYLNPNYFPNPVTGGQFSVFPNPNYYYMKKSSTTPSTFYMDPNVDVSYGYSNYYYDDPNPTFRDERENVADSRADQPRPLAPPPATEGSGWDFFNVFDTYEQYLTDFKGRLGSGSVSSPNSSEIREKEGIPDLEEETEPESFREGEKKKKQVVDSGIGTSKAAPLEEVVEEKTSTVVNEKDSNQIPVGGEEISNRKEETFVRKKGVSFEGEGSIKTEESCSCSSLGSSLVTEERLGDGIALPVHGTKDVVEAVEEIKEQFKSAAGCGEEVARLLEVGKMRYRSTSTLLRVIFARILDSVALSTLTSMNHPSNDVQHPDANVSMANEAVHSGYVNVKSDNLSATLEKLFVWEKKLYKEVKDEEKLRVLYERECRRLKALDDGGAESYKIDSTRAAIRKLHTEISIAIKSVDAISSRIHTLREEELRPQLIELIQGLMTMWKSMLACHHKQFQAIAESKSHNLTARSRFQRNSVAKASMELEIELLNWSSCFRNWISTQKAYIEALNGWLMRWLLQEREETPDGVRPLSPGRIGAPTIFIVSNDWHHAVERISEVGVTTAMQIFADNVHKLWETQDEVQRQKLKTEYLSRDFSRRLRSLQKENGPVDILSEKRSMPLPNGESFPDHIIIALDSMKKRLDEETAKHQEIIKHVQEAASSSLQMGLVPIFEALGNFTTETLNAYERLRIPDDNGEGT